jgi:hypothetical protein
MNAGRSGPNFQMSTLSLPDFVDGGLCTRATYEAGGGLTDSHETEPGTNIIVRTLLAAGYTIAGGHRQPRHIEILCHRTDILGATIPYLIALTDADGLADEEIEDIKRSATSQSRVPVIIARTPGVEWISWDDFTEALGGAVPSWQALSPDYGASLITASENKLPVGTSGEVWLLFEDLTAYGLEFVFGRRVRRLGGRKRGRTVSDMQAQTPQEQVLVVDSKAAGGKGFDVTWPALRALVEYVQRQRNRQRGHLEVSGALVVSSKFRQTDKRLQEISNQFLGEARVTASFIEAKVLSDIVNILRDRPDLRNAVRWSSILTGGRIKLETFERELAAAETERVKRGD